MNFIKQKILRYLNNRIQRKNRIPHINTSFSEAQDFGLLFTWQGATKFEQVKELIRFLDIHNKRFEMLCYVKNPKENYPAELPVVQDTDVSTFGKAKPELLKSFIQKPFDFLWHLDMDSHVLLQYILARTHARCRVGKTNLECRQFYELMIQPTRENDYKEFYEQVFHYTKSIMTYA
jgi:hypothetical protein